ncbi:MAG: hypothetical protein A2855_00085 [Candidatus Liptonbacteria bacterium RIFCSPHIGHO2_01_FULL_57_28]|uniref:DoxX family protein n=1 Tax=Candidatus Liptonbacteria bacterium RIFCSPHIGHO2_01_FULL_57_28 TaxID=1798647 RepID=A0A1G2CBB3_9BACT|nr:MAG: hypothetical protein A2855_00085 [Candidatus Liptonbacteria bacterium RIFCSPHIGHO2_01_FULL_57_28]
MFLYLATYSDITILVLRVALGALLIAHGWPKLRDWKQTTENFNMMGFKPGALFGGIAAVLEFFGGIAIVVGFLVQPIAVLVAIQFTVTTLWRISKKHPYVNGWEIDLLILGSAVLLLSIGAGGYSADAYLLPPGL